jgi:hypothetical protein
MKPWYRLNIDVSDAVSEAGHVTIKNWIDGVPGHAPGGYWRIYHDAGVPEFFTSEFLTNMEERGLPVAMSVCFYRKPHYYHPTAHIDGSMTKKPIYGLNWVYTDNDNSDMIWYEAPKIDVPVTTTEYGTAQVDIDTSTLSEVGRLRVGPQLTLVRVDIPHNIEVQEHARFVISLRCRFDDFESWSDAVNYFEPFISE